MVRCTRGVRWLLVLLGLLPLWGVAPAQAFTPGAQYLSPYPGSSYNPPETTIAIRYGSAIANRSLPGQVFTVRGSESGLHPGRAVLADDGETVIFRPERPFVHGEAVQVQASPGITALDGTIYGEISFGFLITPTASGSPAIAAARRTWGVNETLSLPPGTPQPAAVPIRRYDTAPADFPQITVDVPPSGASGGYIFASNFLPAAFGGAANPGSYLLILDNQGEPVYYQKVPDTTLATDFKVLSDGRLAYWESGSYHLLDDHYAEVAAITPGNGYFGVDPHELLLLPDGHFLFVVDDFQQIDLSKLVPGGNPNATVVDDIIQELDTQGNVVFQWNSLDHIPITDSNQDLTAPFVDYVHMNSLELDHNGNLLVSSRHLSEVTKISLQTGSVIWRLGGKHNQFQMDTAAGIQDDPHFYYQHDIRRLPDGRISMFDNHYLNLPNGSRALEYSLDEDGKKATLVWEYRDSPDVDSPFMGNVQRLANGNTVIGWGGVSNPAVTEIGPDGSKALELGFSPGYVSYRALRFPWHGYPTWDPLLGAQKASAGIHLAFSWNGATDISGYALYGGNTPAADISMGRLAKTGFESTADLSGAQAAYCYYRVAALDLQGGLTRFSNVVQSPGCLVSYLPVVSNSAP